MRDPTLPPATAARRARFQKSILDGAIEETQRLTSSVGPADRHKIDEYLSSIREIERGIERFQQADSKPRAALERPAGTPADYAEHSRLTYQLLALAFQADLTRISTLMVGRESSIRSYDQIGIPESHHQLSHHKNDPATLAKLTRIQTYHLGFFAEFIARLQSMREGEGTVLDRSMIVYGAGISDSNRHVHEDLPILVLGKGNGTLKTGQHVAYRTNTPVTNLHLALLHRLNVRPGRLGDSTGLLEC